MHPEHKRRHAAAFAADRLYQAEQILPLVQRDEHFVIALRHLPGAETAIGRELVHAVDRIREQAGIGVEVGVEPEQEAKPDRQRS